MCAAIFKFLFRAEKNCRRKETESDIGKSCLLLWSGVSQRHVTHSPRSVSLILHAGYSSSGAHWKEFLNSGRGKRRSFSAEVPRLVAAAGRRTCAEPEGRCVCSRGRSPVLRDRSENHHPKIPGTQWSRESGEKDFRQVHGSNVEMEDNAHFFASLWTTRKRPRHSVLTMLRFIFSFAERYLFSWIPERKTYRERERFGLGQTCDGKGAKGERYWPQLYPEKLAFFAVLVRLGGMLVLQNFDLAFFFSWTHESAASSRWTAARGKRERKAEENGARKGDTVDANKGRSWTKKRTKSAREETTFGNCSSAKNARTGKTSAGRASTKCKCIERSDQ